MKRIDLVFFDAGGGHRSAANALKQVIERQQRPWDVRLVNLQEILDPIDVFRRLTGIRLQDLYNLILKRGWTLGASQLLPLIHGVLRLYQPAQRQLLARFWEQSRPDLAVSLIPNFNRVLRQSLHASVPGAEFVTIMTDFADFPPHFWIERQEQHLICGTDRALEQARKMGHQDGRLFRVSGMILNPHFYEPVEIDRAAECARLGLRADLPTGIVLFGGHGSKIMFDIARALDQSDLDLQLILICGHNHKLAAMLRTMPKRKPMHVEGFTRNIPEFMRLSDFLIGKPGPGSISEALAMQLPVIVERNAWTLPQERYNADWVQDHGVGLVVPNFRHIVQATRELLAKERYECFRSRAAACRNQAVFEIPEILEQILARN